MISASGNEKCPVENVALAVSNLLEYVFYHHEKKCGRNGVSWGRCKWLE